MGRLGLILFRRAGDVEFTQGFEIDFGGGIRHQITGFVVFREGNDFTNAAFTGDEHGDAVESKREAAVWWRTKAEGIEDVGELDLLLLGGHTKHAEHFRLQVFFVDPDRTPTEFVAVEDDVVGDGADFLIFARIEQGNVIGIRTSERMVHGSPCAFIGFGEKGEINDPEEIQRIAIFGEIHHVGDFEAHTTKDGAGAFPLASDEEYDIALGNGECADEIVFFIVGKKFPQRALVFAIFAFNEGEGFHGKPRLNGDLVEPVHLAGGDAREAFGVDGFDHAAAVEDGTENLKLCASKDSAKVGDFHVVARVWLIDAVGVHGIAPGHAGKWPGHGAVEAGLEHRLKKAFDEVDDVFLADEGCLDVDLRELGLAVGAKVFIAEAAGDLEIFFQSGDHEELFVLLWRLGEGEEFTGREAGGNEEIARTFGRGVGKDGRFDFDETLGIEVVAGGGGDFVALADVFVHARAAEVEVAIFHPQILVGEFLVELEGQDIGFVDDGKSGRDDFDFSGADFFICGADETSGYRAGDLDHIFVT